MSRPQDADRRDRDPEPRRGRRLRRGRRRPRRGSLSRRVVAFDCDSTLSGIEGIDWLADRRGVGREVAELTDAAMAGVVPLEDVYARRLALVRPDADDLAALARAYAERAVEDAAACVAAFGALGWETWVVSGGLEPAVAPFAEGLGVERERVLAVPYDPGAPEPWDRAARHRLATDRGKREALEEVAAGADRTVLVGDGASDLAARPAVDRFVAFTGVVDRPAVREAADAAIPWPSLAPVLVEVCGPNAPAALAGGPHAAVWKRGAALARGTSP